MPRIHRAVHTVGFSAAEVADFNKSFPDGKGIGDGPCWFAFDRKGELMDTNTPNVRASAELAAIARSLLFHVVGAKRTP